MPAWREPGAHGLPPDPAMPGFAVALDPGLMADMLQEQLLPPGEVCTACRLVRFRYREGERAVVTYELDLRNGLDGPPRRLIVAGRIHADRGPPAPRGPSRSACAPRDGIPSTAYLPQIGMRLEVFPHDRRLPALAAFAAGPSPAALDVLRRGFSRPELAAGDLDMVPVRYRPGLAATLRCRTALARRTAGARTGYLKITAAGEGGQAHDAAGRVDAALVRAGGRLRLSLPTVVCERDNVTFFAATSGATLADALVARAGLAEAAERTGEALAILHRLEPPAIPAVFADDVAEKIERAAGLIAWACPELACHARGTATLARSVTQAGLVAVTHRDMKPDHVFLGPDRAELIDCGSICLGNPLVDVGALLARIDLLAILHGCPDDSADALGRQICTAYFSRVPQAWQRLLPAGRAYGALLVATHAIQGLLPDWRNLVTRQLSASVAAR